MLSIDFLINLAVILLTTKLFGILTKRIQMPQVVGALLAGLIIGPSLLGVVKENEFIDKMAELGVIVLMFNAGLDTDLKELKKSGIASFIIALVGVIVPLLGGFLTAGYFSHSGNFTNIDSKTLLKDIFIGIILTATSVSITVETLQELGKLKTASGTAILGAAVIDDVLGIIALTIVTGVANPSVHIGVVLLKIVGFFILTLLGGLVFYHFFNRLSKQEGRKRRIPLIAFVFCLVMSYIAEEYFGVTDITGAYIAGIVISNTIQAKYIARRIEIISYMLLSPIFFASIGIKTTIGSMNMKMYLFTLVLLLVAILSKIIGCGLGARVSGYTRQESIRIGVGMISRGEVALIIANVGASLGLIDRQYFAPVIIMVIFTTLITPILLKWVYMKKRVPN